MAQPLSLLWLPGLLCDEALFAEVNQTLPEWVTPETAQLGYLDSMMHLASKVLQEAPEHFVLGGLSMGGILAFEVYRQAPERVKGLILLDTNAADEKPEVSERRNALVERALNGEFEAITPDVLMPLLIHPSRLGDTRLTDCISTMAINVGIDAFQAHANALASRSDARPLLRDISVPTLVVTGRDDLLCPIGNHLLMAEQIPDVTLHIIADCGHLSTLEQPVNVGQRINAWLSHHFS